MFRTTSDCVFEVDEGCLPVNHEHTHHLMKTKSSSRSELPPKSGSKRSENKQRIRKAILKAALYLFSKQGFYKTTTRQIAKKARIAEGTMFNYFHTKEDLALYFFEQELVGLMDWYHLESDLEDAPLVEKLFGIINHHLERISPYEDFVGAVYLRSLQVKSKLSPLGLERREQALRYLRFIKEILEEAVEKKEIPDKLVEFGPYGVGLFHLAIITYWLNDCSTGKENTLALLDRCLKMGHSMLFKQGGWDW